MVGSFGVAVAHNVPQLLFWRFWQCVGVSPGVGVGAAVIGDIYRLEERGTALGFYVAVSTDGNILLVRELSPFLCQGYDVGPRVGATNWRFELRAWFIIDATTERLTIHQ